MAVTYLVSSLATFGGTVPGITKSFGLSDLPQNINREDLPAALIVPEVGTEQGLKLLSMMGNSPSVVIEVTQLVLVAESGDTPLREAMPTMLTILDAYNAQAKAQKFLDTQAAPPNQVVMQYSIMLGISEWEGISYHSLSTKHQYTIYG